MILVRQIVTYKLSATKTNAQSTYTDGVQRERFRRIRRLYWHGKRETRTAAAEKTQKRETRNVDRRRVRARVRAVAAVVKAARDRRRRSVCVQYIPTPVRLPRVSTATMMMTMTMER